MKLIAIGDIHGRSCWKKASEKHSFDKLVFIGDYFDSFDISGKDQIANFREIVTLKESYPDKVVLLVGNHDFHYLPVARSVNEVYTGYQDRYAFQIGDLLEQYKHHLSICYRWEDFLFTHAGITHTWLEWAGYKGEQPVEVFINDLFQFRPAKFFFNGWDGYGDDPTQSPLWVRPRSLKKDGFFPENFRQVVGHTAFKKLLVEDERFFFIDTLGTSGEYVILEDGAVYIDQLFNE